MTRFGYVLLLLTLCAAGLASGSMPGTDGFGRLLDSSRLGRLLHIKASYQTTRDGKFNLDTITYDLAAAPVITGVQAGTLANGRYELTMNQDWSPRNFDFWYKSAIENMDFSETYQYLDPKTINYTDRKSKYNQKLGIDGMSADTVTMMEYLVFLDTSKIQELRMTGFITPGAVRLPFVFRQAGGESVTALDGKTYDCLVYEAQLDCFLGPLVKLFYGDAKIWVMKDFPHVRVKMDFFHKVVNMQSCQVSWAAP